MVNVCKKKQLTNTRAAGRDDALRLVPPRKMSLEQCLEFLADDELLEVTPKNLRIRKTILNHERRMKAQHGKKKTKLCKPKDRRKPVFWFMWGDVMSGCGDCKQCCMTRCGNSGTVRSWTQKQVDII